MDIDIERLVPALVAAIPIITRPVPRPPALDFAPLLLNTLFDENLQDHARMLGTIDPVLLMYQQCQSDEESTPVIGRPLQGGQRITEEWLQSRTDEDLRYRFGMRYHDLLEMKDSFCVPDTFRTSHGYVFDGLEAFTLLCARYRSAGNLYDLVKEYDRSQASLSQCINELVEFLDEKWEHLLDYDNEDLLAPSELLLYADAIRSKGAPTKNVFAFIDCTIRRIARPTWYQRQAYSGHKKYHALKFQALMLPNGLFGHLWGGVEGRRNVNALLNESNLMERLAEFAIPEGVDEGDPIEDQYFQVFGDPAYGIGPHMMSPFSGAGERTEREVEFNAQMSAVRIEVEHGFGIVVNKWPFLNAFWKMRVYVSPVGRYYRVGVLLTNAMNCLEPNQVAQYFECPPPRLSDYLHPPRPRQRNN